ncbi:MAG TPA: YraN family protein [Firmicutes bacterium]|nr:YraN family protein [Bacillota bacterium]
MPGRSRQTGAGGRAAGEAGRSAEEAAALYLRRLGYRIVSRNYRCRQGEIDIIAWDGPNLVFVEVRQRTDGGLAAESIDSRKRRKIVAAARHYLYRLAGQAAELPPCRFDAVCLALPPAGQAEAGAGEAGAGETAITLLKNAFDLSDLY